MTWENKINQKLKTNKNNILVRNINVTTYYSPCYIQVLGKNYCNFSSNDYLNLSHDSRIINAWKKGAEIYGVGSGGSSYMSGYTTAHEQLETRLADWLGYTKSILFISGFSANQAVISTLLNKEDIIFADKKSHASIIETCVQNSAALYRFKHNSIEDLNQLNINLNTKNKLKLIITEGVFSMDGDMAPLKLLNKFSEKPTRMLLVDDAHGIGVIGKNGKGSCDYQNIKPHILMITFGKAFGISGAAVLCNNTIYKYLRQFSKHLICSTAMPPAQAYTLLKSLDIIQTDKSIRDKLNENINYFCSQAKHLSFQLLSSRTAIQPIIIGNNEQTILLSNKLKKDGIWTNAIRSPTVPIGTERLRITINAMHSKKDINKLLEKLHEYNNK
ncbi:8-amino-7-oxononanoate synthase [Buchnera aphidicola (Eriosoma lanigerum)]|uniref:aminotransferase class I/II-fold pyridoxal phosphate-dependent enzyme n=1 Tax=Buchnera aphidicola TaxID=9 RepID=UPI003464B779